MSWYNVYLIRKCFSSSTSPVEHRRHSLSLTGIPDRAYKYLSIAKDKDPLQNRLTVRRTVLCDYSFCVFLVSLLVLYSINMAFISVIGTIEQQFLHIFIVIDSTKTFSYCSLRFIVVMDVLFTMSIAFVLLTSLFTLPYKHLRGQ